LRQSKSSQSFFVVFLIAFHSTYLDEPIDYAIYLITGALGFAAVENILFLIEPALQQDISFIIETGTLRFLGATVLHSVLAAILGIIVWFLYSQVKRYTVSLYSTGIGNSHDIAYIL